MIIVGKLIVLAGMLFQCFCLIGMMKMGEEDFMVLLGGKLVKMPELDGVVYDQLPLASHGSS